MIALLAVGGISFLIGSIPFGLLIARAVAGIDLRQAGSGNIGATNVTRVVGKTWGAVVLLLDALKGALPAGVLPALLAIPAEQQLHAAVLGGLMAILGHMFSPWLKFRGGKGVATAMGAVFVLAPIGLAVAFLVFVILVSATRIVSIGSISAAVSFAITQVVVLQPDLWSAQRWSLTAFSLGVPTLIIFQHRSNIRRLIQGQEHAFRKSPETASASSATSDPPPTAP